MPRYVALLRAINVGGHAVKMDRLRTLFEEMGFASVETFIASGNVIFDAKETNAAKLEKQIETHLEKALGYEVGTYLRTPEELKAAAEHEPFPRVNGDGVYVIFVRDAPDAEARKRLAALNGDDDRFAVRAREVYWWRVNARMSDSQVSGAQLARAIGQPGTNRNVTSVRKMAAKYG